MSKANSLTATVRGIGFMWFFAGLIMLAGQVANAQEVAFRVNAGGGTITSIDSGPNWGADTNASTSPYLDAAYVAAGNLKTSVPSAVTLDASVPTASTPPAIFQSERWDPSGGAVMAYRFPALAGSSYEVRLFLADGYSGSQNPGDRIFNIDVEGVTVTNTGTHSGTNMTGLDLIDLFTDQKGVMLATNVVAGADGLIDIVLSHNIKDNPLINGIEIICPTSCPVPVSVDPIDDQNIEADQSTDIALSASDVNGTSNFTISSSTPDISGFASIDQDGAGNATLTLSPLASDKGSYDVTINVTDDTDTAEETFTLIVLAEDELVLYRINVGGPELMAADFTLPAWGADADSPQPVSGGANFFNNSGSNGYKPIVAGEALPASAPLAMFETERNDLEALPEMMYALALPAGTVVDVRLYFAELFTGITAANQRIFDVNIEGTLIEDIDAYAAAGGGAGIMRSAQVVISPDGLLNIDFITMTQRTALKGIEVISAGPRPQSDALFRVNAGGPQLLANDLSLPDWSADSAAVPSAFLIAGGDSVYDISAGNAYSPIVATDLSIPGDTPTAAFETERYNSVATNMQWQFPVTAGNTYEVRLAFAELFSGITATGDQRIFDVALEGMVRPELSDINPFDRAGPAGAFVISTLVTVHDANLDIEFLKIAENPAIKGIEIIPVAGADSDLDSVPDVVDNCSNAANGDQRDTDSDGFGNVCDADFNNSGFVNYGDLAILRSRFGSDDPDADMNGDGVVNFADLAAFKAAFGQAPGPSGAPD